MIKYGLISNADARCLEKTIDLILNQTEEKHINVVEVGCYGGDTGSGIGEYIFSNHRIPVITGIDNKRDNEEIRFKYDKLIIGNSAEVYNEIEDDSQHLIFVDGNHSFPAVVADFFCYASKVKNGGYMAFHDTAQQAQGKDWQRMGSNEDPDMYISVRKALGAIGMFEDAGYDAEAIRKGIRYQGNNGFRLIFDEADPSDEAGGVCVFKKMYR